MNFVFDIDGTLCFNGQTIDEPIIAAIDRLLVEGHTVVFASARPIRDLLPVLPKHFHKLPLIGGNGAFTSLDGNIEAVFFDARTQSKLLQLIDEHHCTYLADSDWDYAYTASLDHPIYKQIHHEAAHNLSIDSLRNICKLVLFQMNRALQQQLAKLPVVVTPYKTEQIFDISPQNITKARGMKHLQIDQYIAFGNDANDKPLFEQAAFSVCIGEQEVKAFADKVIPKEAVARTINELREMIQRGENAYVTSE